MKKPRPEEMKGLARGHLINGRAGTRIKYPISKMIESSQAVCPCAWSCRGLKRQERNHHKLSKRKLMEENLLEPLSVKSHIFLRVIPFKNIGLIFSFNLNIFWWRQFIFN